VIRQNANIHLIALADRVVRFDHATHGVTEIRNGFSADALAFDPANGVLYAAQGAELHTIDPNTGTIIATTGTGGPIGHILPLLNR